jgi:hypothetical protein
MAHVDLGDLIALEEFTRSHLRLTWFGNGCVHDRAGMAIRA